MVTVRREEPDDHAAVYRLNALAFEGEAEARLVEKLRAVEPYISLVAVEDDRIVGHILFSPVSVESGEMTFMAMGLAPMAVSPERQRQGIGSQLVRRGLEECQREGHSVVFVLGHPEYYPRFGFSTAPARGLACEYSVPDDVFMVIELKAGALRGRTGLVRYRPEFADA